MAGMIQSQSLFRLPQDYHCIDPLTALAVSYQETQLNKDAPFNINPQVYGKPTGNAEEGLKSLEGQFQYAKNLQGRGIIPQGEDYLIQGNNGYGIIKRGHADLEGAHKIYDRCLSAT